MSTAEALARGYLRRLAGRDPAPVHEAAMQDPRITANMPEGTPVPRAEIARACLAYARGAPTPRQERTDAWRCWFLVDQVWRS